MIGLRPPHITITKAVRADPAADFVTDLVVPVGTTVTYRITVTNASDVAVDGITLIDDHTDLSVLAGCVIPASLAPGDSFSCTYSAVVVAGTVENPATATAPRPTRRSAPARGSPAPRSSPRRRRRSAA